MLGDTLPKCQVVLANNAQCPGGLPALRPLRFHHEPAHRHHAAAHRRRLWRGSLGMCPPIIKLGKKPFSPQLSRGEFLENIIERNKRQRNKISNSSEIHNENTDIFSFSRS